MEKLSDKDIDPAITEEYEIGETLGTGHFSKVKLGINKKTGEKVAIKIIVKPKDNKMHMLKTEVDILVKADHPNVVKLYKVHETDTVLYLVLEILSGGELFDRIVAKGHYSEADARKLTIVMVKAIKYLHDIGIAHRDLKPENLLLKDSSEEAVVKITDFGLSKIFASDAEGEVVMKTACGTPGYVAPEVLMHDPYSSQVDLWSIGVIVYILLCGFPPFYGDNDAQMFRKIKAAQYKFLAPYWDPISADAKDFISKLLVVDPKKRMTCDDALLHPWIKEEKRASTKNLFEGMEQKEVKAGDETSVQEQMDNMHASFVDFNLDRKMGQGMAKLNEHFDLPAGSMRLWKGKCALISNPGQMYVTSSHLCFMGMNKKACIPLAQVTKVQKAKRFKISPGDGHAIHIFAPGSDAAGNTNKDGKFEFNGFFERDECIAAIREAASKVGANIAFD